MSERSITDKIASDQFGEQLSVLMDGELPRDQLRFLLRRLDADAELVQRWSRYQIARNSLRRQPVLPLRLDFSEVLMQRVVQEELPVSSRSGAILLRWVGGGAIAAAVAVVALVVTRPQIENVAAGGASVAAVTAAAAPPSRDPYPAQTLLPPLANFDYAQPASFDTGASFYSGAGSYLNSMAIPRYDPRRRYEATPAGSVSGFMPYVLLTPARPPQGTLNPVETPQP